MGSASEDEDEDDVIRPPLSLGHLGPNGPESVGHLGASDLSVQSMSTDSKNGHDDSDQVNIYHKTINKMNFSNNLLIIEGFIGWRS